MAEQAAVLYAVEAHLTKSFSVGLARPGARLLVEVDPRSASEVRRHDELVARASGRLEAVGEPELADQLRADGNLFAILLSGDLPDDVVADITELVDLFLPTAVVVAPPEE